ncbi:P-loop containing nucleoside triphosphate hydrolase protein [Pholiota molesta]|nr:P-loop containing nucleoside triphosphate hydrolase protein [Pholiota molesta]
MDVRTSSYSGSSLEANVAGSVLSFEHLSYAKLLLDDVSVDIRAGELLAVMGPSGAGKSTLLDVMSSRKRATEGGTVHLNEQEDALLGVLTVRESISYALRLYAVYQLPLLQRSQVSQRVERVIKALGLQSCAEQRIGTPIQRVTAACAMITFPRILYLDEVTSGEVMTAISSLAKAEGMIVIASIHQPSLETLAQFTNVMFLAEGKTCYLGRKWGRPVGRFTTPSDHAMNFLNSDFAAVNYQRNLLAYGVRAGMYAGESDVLFVSLNLLYFWCYLIPLLATIWIRLGNADSTINDRLSVHFYSVAFLLLLFLEERAVYYRETKNGLYTTLPFILSNTLVNIPFLFVCTVIFTVICYWAIGLHAGAAAFFRFLIFLFLAIFAAETQALVVASLLPYSAFMNGFWMSVGGYLWLPLYGLPKYAFELITNVMYTREAGQCVCAYPSSTPETCTVSGEDVLAYLGIGEISYGKWAGILLSIVIIYRIILFFTLKLRST